MFLLVLSIHGQTTLTLQPNGNFGKDAFISSNVPTASQGNSPKFDAAAWTVFSVPVTIRGLIDFDLSSLPEGATIQSATLTLYNNPNAVNGNANGQHVHSNGSNESVLQRITSPWTEDVAWSNQPTTTSQNEVTLPQDIDPFQDYVLDVTNLLQDSMLDPNNSFGFLLKLKNETPWRLLAFASSDHPNPDLHPKLEITYSIACNMITLQPDAPTSKDAFISSNVLTVGQGNSPEFDAAAWTIFSSPITIRGLIDFDLSTIPTDATIVSATLTLYNNPNAVNGNANGQHVHSTGTNESVLQRITSPWTEDVAWSNQPTTTSQNEVTLPQDIDPFQDYVVDVTNLAQDIVANPNNSFGFLLKLKNETPWRLLAFASSDHPNPDLHPKLEICYNNLLTTNNPIIENDNLFAYPNPTSGIVNIDLKNSSIRTSSDIGLVVFDATGKKVFEKKYTSSTSLAFDVSNLQNGMYYWFLTAEQSSYTGKLILTK